MGADRLLACAAVADRPPRRVDAAGQRRCGDDPAAPDGLQEVVLADHTIAVIDQIEQQIEDLRLDGDEHSAPRKLAPTLSSE